MAGRTLPAVNRPGRTSLDQERENFEKNQTLAISKAVNDFEVPTKAKHVRSAVIGTFQEKGSNTFWSIILRMPLHSNPIMAWKFCHCLHKMLREGHANVLKDSQRHREYLVEKGKFWGHIKDGYGKLIYLYCRLLVVKLDFHRRNSRFPGNLFLKDEELELICEHDINSYFQLSVELLDYMDEILALQAAVFGSLDMSRSNSMTNAGQCRLAPLIVCIQDSSQVYDYIVKLLFKLHNCLPPDTLEGHRLRFLKQFKALRQFYLQSANLQYFKTLIQVPFLDANPPNFLISSEINRHTTPIVVLPPEPEPTPIDANLVQFDSEENGSSSPDLLAERDRYIEHLLHQIEQLTTELEYVRMESLRQSEALQHKLVEFEMRLSEKQLEVDEALQGKEDIEKKLSEAAQSAQEGSVVQLQLQEMEKRSKGWEDKFVKLKDVYQKLRDEHINLLRQKAEADKKLSVANAAIDQSNKIQAELQNSLELSKVSVEETTRELQSMQLNQDEKLSLLMTEKEELTKAKNQLQDELLEQAAHLNQIRSELEAVKLTKEDLSLKVEQSTTNLELSSQALCDLQKELQDSKVHAQVTLEELKALNLQQEDQLQLCRKEKDELQIVQAERDAELEKLKQHVLNITTQLSEVQVQKDNMKLELNKCVASLEESFNSNENLKRELDEATTKIASQEEDLIMLKSNKEEITVELQKGKEQFEYETSKLSENIKQLDEQIRRFSTEQSVLEEQIRNLMLQLKQDHDQHVLDLNASKLHNMNLLRKLLVECALKADNYLEKIVSDLFKAPIVAPTPQDIGCSTHGAQSLFEILVQELRTLLVDNSEETISRIIPTIYPLGQSIAISVLHGQHLAHSLPDLEKVDEMLGKCTSVGKVFSLFFKLLQKAFDCNELDGLFNQGIAALRELEILAESVTESLKANADKNNVGEELENELAAMERAIQEAADRIAKLWDNSKRSQTGVKLEVNGKVLDSCDVLMKAIIELIRKAKILQEEIVARGKGSASSKEFYKRNHRWSEGVLSAAKAVGFGAKLLTDAADKVVQGQGKFEQLQVASQEIAASTAQLVFASRVKAELQSKNLQALAEASKVVSSATGAVVATAKHCAELVEDSTVLDFANQISTLSLHQAKRFEMESQVKVLELESSLEKERLKLAKLRKQHYQLAESSEIN